MSQEAWVNFKSFVVIPLVFLFTLGLVFWIMRRQSSSSTGPGESA